MGCCRFAFLPFQDWFDALDGFASACEFDVLITESLIEELERRDLPLPVYGVIRELICPGTDAEEASFGVGRCEIVILSKFLSIKVDLCQSVLMSECDGVPLAIANAVVRIG